MNKELREYFNKDIRLVDIDGKIWIGFVETYTPKIDSDEEYDEIGLQYNGNLISFTEVEIQSIEII